ncbi:MAG: VWA domain-containing protein, partial [Ktedonobacteraceae bacterium]|nr:VWA domain-containing protein [Ktedonobacteraceae bacterium]
MDRVINDFIALLRQQNIRVSPVETLDALHALSTTGLSEREVVRDALRTTIIKSAEDGAVFDRLFDLYFGLHPVTTRPSARFSLGEHDHDHGNVLKHVEFREDLAGEARDDEDHQHSHEDPSPTEMRRFFEEDKLRPSTNIHGEEPDRLRLSLFAQELILNRKQESLQKILQKISHHLHVRRARNIFQPGSIAPSSDGEELPIDIAAAEMQELVDHLHELEVDETLIQQLQAMTEHVLQELPALFKKALERQRALQNRTEHAEIQSRSLRRLLNFSIHEQREMETAIRRMARQIQGANSRRMQQDREGRISLSHTLRQSLRYDGLPFRPVLRNHREQRPRLVLLCDVSLSTRNLARFWLHLIYQMQNLFSKVRTFVFVAELAEVTRLFEEQPISRAIETIFSGHLLDVDASSDFGRAAEQFRTDFLSATNRRTTVVVLGDGRNNGRQPNVAALEEIARHARQVIWLTPEPPWGWSLGSCDMPLYEPVCHRVEVVRTIEQLA